MGEVLGEMKATEQTAARFSDALKASPLRQAVASLDQFNNASIKLIQIFYRVRAQEITPILQAQGFKLVRVTSRGTEIYPTMCDFEKRDVDRYIFNGVQVASPPALRLTVWVKRATTM